MAAMGQTAGLTSRRNLAKALADAGAAPVPLSPLLESPRPGHSPRFGDALAAEVIPRLRLAHAVPSRRLALTDTARIDALGAMLLRHDGASAAAYVGMLRRTGVTAEDIYLDLLAPTAQLLGQFWADDVCDFATVTLGVGHLRSIRETLLPHLVEGASVGSAGHSVLLAPVPGEQHVFGLEMVADFFRRAGWQTQCAPVRSISDLTGLLRRTHVDVLGLTLGATQRMDVLAATIRRARQASRHRGLAVMVGGPAFIGHPERAALVGADATAPDAREAPIQAARLLRLLAERA
jgi:MerR family transcriptional regulator, light-induced transcriptional regulator